MTKKKEARIFESITDKQADFIHALCNESMDFDQAEFDSKLILLTGFPSVENLSKQEASFIIDKLQGKTGPDDKPFPPRTETAIGKGAEHMPTAAQIYSIRESVKKLGWSEEYLKQWLERGAGVSSINKLDRKAALKAVGKLFALRKLQYTI